MKKKIVTIIIATLMPVSLWSGSGDLNGDNLVNIADLVELINYLRGEVSSYFNTLEADVNDDGYIDKNDIDCITNIILTSSNSNNNPDIDSDTESNIINIVTEATCNDAIGTFKMSNSQVNALAAFYGENTSGIDEFPYAGIHFNVGGTRFAYYLEQGELPQNGIEILNTSDYITGGTGNAGRIFFTIKQPDNEEFDIKKYEFKLIDSKGNISPIKISNARKSNSKLTWSNGKKEFEDVGNTDDNSLYEIYATIEENNFEASKLGIEKLIDYKKLKIDIRKLVDDYNNMEVSGSDGYTVRQTAYKNMSRDLISMRDITIENELSSTNMNISYSPQRIGLYMTEDGVSKKQGQSNLDIFATAVKPLSYNTFWEYENLNKDNRINESPILKVAANIAKEIVESFGFNNVTVEIIGHDDAESSITLSVNNSTYTIIIDDDELYGNLQKALDKNYGKDEVNSMINKLLKCYTLGSVNNKLPSERIQDFLSNASNYYFTLNNHIFSSLVAPFILFETINGVECLCEGQYIKSGVMHTYLTSPTYETIVPAYKKYVALKKDNEFKRSIVLPGRTKTFDFNLTETGDYTIIISCVDYYGYVVTKKYNIHVVE